MGGAACAVPHNAILGGETSPPTDPHKWPLWDIKLRRCFEQSDIVAGIVEKGYDDQVCDLLKKSDWSLEDRTTLCDLLDSLYEDE